ncbi:MAG TPA: PP2C family protein-serine/threonine phosphatase [Acidimicrobiales bacterium]|nr:PP2C family protein-serine/threonine phosphatase [Acidimicrobiales bacterium]
MTGPAAAEPPVGDGTVTGTRRIRGALRPSTLVVGLIILTGTLVLALIAQVVNRGSDQRLVNLQVRQAATALAAALPTSQTEMVDGLQVARATGSTAAFKQFMTPHVGRAGFASVSLWRRSGTAVSMEALVGARPALAGDGRADSFLTSIAPSPQLSVAGLLADGPAQRIGFAEYPPGDQDLVVYAETVVPAGHHLDVPRTSAFSDLNFALYLGRSAAPSQLIESSVPTPIRGVRSLATVPFGDTSITVVGTPTTNLAGALSAALPWIVLGAGLVFAVGSMMVAEYVSRRRTQAEELARENERLYLEQRSIASDFQQALLPDLPRFDGLEVGARYIAGTEGLDVGGDWYDVIQNGPRRCTFVVGDVCGHGLKAATTMASLRFASRAYLAEGADPASLLERLGHLEDLDDDTFATVLVGTVDLDSRRMVVASAGHPPPLLLSDSHASFVPLTPTAPIGVERARPEPLTTVVPDGAVVVAYTDGLVERRGEAIDVGLERLRSIRWRDGASVEEILDRLVATLLPGGAGDDTALLAMRWQGGCSNGHHSDARADLSNATGADRVGGR